MTDVVYLSLGSNIGDRLNFLNSAISRIAEIPQVKIIAKSTVYETEPVGEVKQDDFLNMVISVETSLEPHVFLEKAQEIEKSLKRERKIHWGPRTIDIDILLWGKERISTEVLQVPHKEMEKREFVIVPLMEIYEKNNTIEIDFDKILKKLNLNKVRKYNG